MRFLIKFKLLFCWQYDVANFERCYWM